jgi:hypothetical protein
MKHTKFFSDLRKNLKTDGKTEKFLAVAVAASPAFFFVIIGLMLLIAPRLLATVLACLFIFFGISLALLTWRVMVLKNRLAGFLRGMEGRVIIHRPDIARPDRFSDKLDDKKVILH